MAARINRRHQQMVRDKVRASQLVNRLENHVLPDDEGQTVDMTPTQLSAALGLLKKCVPDLKQSDDTLTVDGKVGIENYIVNFKDGDSSKDD